MNPNHNSMADDSIDEEREEDVDTFRDDSQALLRSIRECINNVNESCAMKMTRTVPALFAIAIISARRFEDSGDEE